MLGIPNFILGTMITSATVGQLLSWTSLLEWQKVPYCCLYTPRQSVPKAGMWWRADWNQTAGLRHKIWDSFITPLICREGTDPFRKWRIYNDCFHLFDCCSGVSFMCLIFSTLCPIFWGKKVHCFFWRINGETQITSTANIKLWTTLNFVKVWHFGDRHEWEFEWRGRDKLSKALCLIKCCFITCQDRWQWAAEWMSYNAEQYMGL